MKNKIYVISGLTIVVIAALYFFSFNNTNGNSKSSSGPEHLTAASFKQKVFDFEKNKEWKFEGDLPCIVDFYADWCGPCKRVAPILEDLSKEYSGKIRVYKVNTDEERELASAFQIQSIPTLLFIPRNGQPQVSMGAMQKEDFVKVINDILLTQKN